MNIVKMSLRTLVVLMLVVLIAGSASAAGDDNESTVAAMGKIGAGIAVGLAGVGAGLSQGNIGAAAVGMLAEDASRFGHAIIFTALPESIVNRRSFK